MGNGITSFGTTDLPDRFTRKCANPLCPNRFAAKNVQQQYCSPACARKEIAEFIAVDGEGTGRGKNHEYVLLGVGQRQREYPGGLSDITEVFEFLYDCYLDQPNGIYTGFYLGYDFNMWLRELPRERAWMLLTKAGQAKRRRTSPNGHYLGPWPVEYKDWQFDMLADKRFKLKPKAAKEWMYICDSGPFFQCSLLSAIDPKTWNEPVVSAEEFETVKAGKERRDSAALDEEMKFYNRLENEILSRLMTRYREGLGRAGVSLKRQQWFGPGQAAQTWMRNIGTLDRVTEAVRKHADSDESWWDAVVSTYYGGWFEIAIHGHIPEVTYGYDINSAYPHVASQLPCVCAGWRHGNGSPSHTAHGPILVNCIARGKNRYLGGMPYRTEDNHVLRPRYTRGWYWLHEIQAAKRAGLIDDVTYYEWYAYKGCDHEPPLRQLADLYKNRLAIGKDTPAGKAFKLIYNSVYGKLCQSTGETAPPFSNPVYASLITAGCRTMILDAIASHPLKAEAVAMVATDGIYFTEPHPTLEVSESELGKWSVTEHQNLTLFKPGIYWDDKARDDIARGEKPHFKARGINAADFGKAIGTVDALFRGWNDVWLPGMPPGKEDWPSVDFHARFAQTTVRQAVQWTEGVTEPAKRQAMYRNAAGRVKEDRKLRQDSYPGEKRNPSATWYDEPRGVWRTQPWDGGPHWPPSKPYDKNFGRDDADGFGEFVSDDAPVMQSLRSVFHG